MRITISEFNEAVALQTGNCGTIRVPILFVSNRDRHTAIGDCPTYGIELKALLRSGYTVSYDSILISCRNRIDEFALLISSLFKRAGIARHL